MEKIIFICQVIDQDDYLLASTVAWVRELAKRPEIGGVKVLTLRRGKFELPENVEVVAIKKNNRWLTLINFYREIFRDLKNTGPFFIYMGGPYPLLLWPIKLITRKPVYQWKAHPYIKPSMKFYARFCVDKIFTSAKKSFPMKLKKIEVVGQGVDINKFFITKETREARLATVGRVTPVKRLEKALLLLVEARDRLNKKINLDIYGPTLDNDQNYRLKIERLIEQYNLKDQVTFYGAVKQDQLVEILNRYKIFISFNAGAVDRSVIEALACGVPVVTPNQCVEEILTRELRERLIVADDDVAQQAERVVALLESDQNDYKQLSNQVREFVIRDHSIEALIGRITNKIYAKKN